MSGPAPAAPEFSRPVRIDEIAGEARRLDIEAGASEREALARRFGLQAITRLAARLTLARPKGGRHIRLTGEFDADVVQTCVVTLEPVASHIGEPIEIVFDPMSRTPTHEVVVDAADLDVEPLTGDVLDLGEVVAEELALSLDPYPRAAGVTLETAGLGPGAPGSEPGHRPFEILARFKRSQ